MALDRAQREEFLAEPHIGALSIEAGPDRAPLTVPIWYQYTPGGDLWFLTGTDSRKMTLLREAGRCTMMAESTYPTIRYVAVSGNVSETRESSPEDLREMAARYLPADKVEAYLQFAASDHGDQSRVTITPAQWVSADLGSI
ncbi:pyridoxamine 5'-phosphate oxidase family protein [Gordonia jinhuaensis]|uniref:Pyridoxamine 5'-phosphate oxidase n=1 Tax=Gordonia jinhuaensis TaxID=1517702 RepID=A0A916WYJ4_9ACTN|nr:pyridoxamine 5'-phosphate oxidase family protein [Gordonia jinhuaensis]GGB42418.1 pyridoxamine 5'-phosphate oxidase [Gordonia jinhuaensis]